METADIDNIDEGMARLEILNALQDHLGFPAEGSEESGSDVSQDNLAEIVDSPDIDDDSELDSVDEEWQKNIPNQEGFIINDQGRVRIHDPPPYDGDLGFTPPIENIESFLYKPP